MGTHNQPSNCEEWARGPAIALHNCNQPVSTSLTYIKICTLVTIKMFHTSKLIFLCLVTLPATLGDGHDGGYDYYDINSVYDEFFVSCGTSEDRYMRITYGGDAFSVYAAGAPTDCVAEEVAPAVFLIDIPQLNNTLCPLEIVETGGDDATIIMLDVVVQRGTVRQWSDDYKQITCNYGYGGHAENSETSALEGAVDKTPVWQNADNAPNVTDIVSLHVFDTANDEVSSVVLGNYIQLRAHLTTDSAASSIKVFNCRAYSGNMQYYMLMGGCGEGDVMPNNRGFRTREEAVEGTTVSRVSRSAYFKSFLLPAQDSMQFECDYIICSPEMCDGYSCANSIMLNQTEASPESRRKRSVSDDSLALPSSHMPKIRSSTLKILPQDSQAYSISSSDLIRAEEKPAASAVVPVPREREVYYSTVQEPEAYPTRTSVYAPGTLEGLEAVLGMDAMTVGLIAGLCLLLILLVVTLTCALVCRRMMQPHPSTSGYYQHHPDASIYSPSSHNPNLSPVYIPRK